jgi:transglutaminase-like putative cysteine protease
LLETIVPQRKNPLADLEAVMTFADRNFVYDHDKASLKASSVHALENRRGHCSDYHGFCAAAGRVMKLPTRVTYGINPFPKASPSHCKLEVFLPPHGWVSFDVSETQKLSQSIRKEAKLSEPEKGKLIEDAHRRLVSGFRDNTWFLQTRGTDYDLAPKASRKVAVVRTLYAEADGRALPDPDPSSSEQTTFAWMTAHRFESNVPATNPFTRP